MQPSSTADRRSCTIYLPVGDEIARDEERERGKWWGKLGRADVRYIGCLIRHEVSQFFPLHFREYPLLASARWHVSPLHAASLAGRKRPIRSFQESLAERCFKLCVMHVEQCMWATKQAGFFPRGFGRGQWLLKPPCH